MKLDKTGFCWNCGLPCDELFCNAKCEKAYNRKKSAQDNRQIRDGKKKGYGVAGNAH